MDETKIASAPGDLRRVLGVVATVALGGVVAAAIGMGRRHSLETPAALSESVPAVVPPPNPAGSELASAVAPPSATSSAPARERPSEARIALGKRIFFDPKLSEPAGTSCASCHDPALAYAGNHGSKNGVALGSRSNHFARRSTPSVLYLKFVRPFHFHWDEDAPLPDARGGFFWDGRSDGLASLVRQPLLNLDEMGNRSPDDVANKVRAAPYAGELRSEFGESLATTEGALTALGNAVEAFLMSDAMSPFSSKYDDYVRGRGKLDDLEQRGLAAFKDPARGNCSSCHRLNEKIPNPERSLFTDYGYETVAVPRNRRIPQNQKAGYFDLGLCEQATVHAHAGEERLCGSFRTPSLRNVAVRPSYMHNGVFTKLRDVVVFYATRGTEPRHWYGSAGKFDDLPERYRGYVNVERAPYDRLEGARPRLGDADIDAIVAFLGTLTDRSYQ